MSQPHPPGPWQPPAAPVNVNVNVNVHTGGTPVPVQGAVPAWPGIQPHAPIAPVQWAPPQRAAVAAPSSPPWWKSSRFWFFALPIATGGLASWVPPLWVASKVSEGQLKARLYTVAAVLALVGAVLIGAAPEDAMGNASGPLADLGGAILFGAIAIGTGIAIAYRQRVFPTDRIEAGSGQGAGQPLLPGVQAAQERRHKRAQYRSLAATDAVLAREMKLGRPDLVPAFDDGGLVDLNALDASALERYAGVTAVEAASIVSTRDKLGHLSSVDELIVHGDLTLATAERLREHAVFIG